MESKLDEARAAIGEVVEYLRELEMEVFEDKTVTVVSNEFLTVVLWPCEDAGLKMCIVPEGGTVASTAASSGAVNVFSCITDIVSKRMLRSPAQGKA